MMSSPRSVSPRPVTPKKDEESFWDKLGTLGRKKQGREQIQAVEAEGKNAIDDPSIPVNYYIPPEEYNLAEGQEMSLVLPYHHTPQDERVKRLKGLLIQWINDTLADQRIIVRDVTEDLYDGQILQKLLEKLTGTKIRVAELSQSTEGQKQKLKKILEFVNTLRLSPRGDEKWSVDAIHSKSLVPILHLLVALVRRFQPPLRLPDNVVIENIVVKKCDGKLLHWKVQEAITDQESPSPMLGEKDAYDSLFEEKDPRKIDIVKGTMLRFVNGHLSKISYDITNLEEQLHDGVCLILLMGLINGYFVPLYEFHPTPQTFQQKVFNVSFAFELMKDAHISDIRARPEDVVNKDLKSTLRVLHVLFQRYR